MFKKNSKKLKEAFGTVFAWCAKQFDIIFDFLKKNADRISKWVESKYKKHNKFFKRTYLCLGWFLWICLLVSLVVEFINGGSICRTLLKSNITLQHFFNLEAIGKVCETIGISSLLIVWLYSSFDREEIGLKYIEILRFEHKYYYLYTISHIVSISVAIWASKTNALEIGLIALLIVIWGSTMHLVFICKLLFIPQSKRRISKSIWQHRIDNTDKEFDYWKHIYTLTDIIDVKENINLDDTSELIADAMLKMPGRKAKTIDVNIYNYQSIWKNLLEKYNDEKRMIITELILTKISEESDFKEEKINICAGYILWQYNDMLKSQYKEDKEKNSITNIIIRLDILCPQIKNLFIQQLLFAFTYCLMWLVFFNKRINLDNDLLEKSNSFQFNELKSDEMKQYITAFSQNLEFNNEDAIGISLEQLY